MSAKRGSSEWIANTAQMLTEDLLGIEIHTNPPSNSGKNTIQVAPCYLFFIVGKEPTKDTKRQLNPTQIAQSNLALRQVWEIRFSIFSKKDCPTAMSLVKAANEQALEIPEGITFPNNRFGMYRSGIRPNVNGQTFVFIA